MNKLLCLGLFSLIISACQYEEEGSFGPELPEPTEINVGPEESQAEGEEGSLTLYRVNANTIEKVKDYAVDANLRPYQQDRGRHQEMWDYVTRLLPLASRARIAEFEVFHGDGDLLGYVAPINEQDLSKWRFALAIDAAGDLSNIDFQSLFAFVSIHEYGHILSLNESQLKSGIGESSCTHFHPGEGCSTPNSYINRLFLLGWADIYDELDLDDPEDIYYRYPERFVSEYAATNPGEDIAEVFSFFVTSAAAPTGNSIADQKIQLMYEYPELVSLREDIRSSIGEARMPPTGSLGTQAAFKRFQLRRPGGCVH
ncbi:MAG: hypothetical protein AAF433_10480 [Bacteroidota bacterium]